MASFIRLTRNVLGAPYMYQGGCTNSLAARVITARFFSGQTEADCPLSTLKINKPNSVNNQLELSRLVRACLGLYIPGTSIVVNPRKESEIVSRLTELGEDGPAIVTRIKRASQLSQPSDSLLPSEPLTSVLDEFMAGALTAQVLESLGAPGGGYLTQIKWDR